MEVVTETERMYLRRFTESDVDNLVALDGDAEVMRYLDNGKPKGRADIERTTLPGLLRSYRDGGGCWAAVAKQDNGFLGWAELEALGDDTFELGYRMRRSCWGKGYASEAAIALVRMAFTDLGARRVMATTMTVNAGSRRVMEKAGLRYQRTVFLDWPEPIEGAELGDVEYELDRADWLRTASQH